MAKRNVTVLVTCSGGSAGINCIKSLREQTTLNCKIISVDKNPLSGGRYLSDKFYAVPEITSSSYIPRILEISIKEEVEIILPTNGIELSSFSLNKLKFKDHGILLNVPDVNCLEIFRDKWKTFNFLESQGISTPATELCETDRLPKSKDGKYFVKPRFGAGSKNSFKASDENDLRFYLRKYKKSCVVQEFINAPEVTIDLIADDEHNVVSHVGRERIIAKNGMVIVSKTKKLDGPIVEFMRRAVSKGNIVGPANIQFFAIENAPMIFDINIRFAAGGLLLSKKAGLNIALNTVLLALHLPPAYSSEIDNDLLMIRIFDELFVKENDAGRGT